MVSDHGIMTFRRKGDVQIPSALFQGLLTEWVRMGSVESRIVTFAIVIFVNNPTKTIAQPNPALNGLGNPALRTMVEEESIAGSVLLIYW